MYSNVTPVIIELFHNKNRVSFNIIPNIYFGFRNEHTTPPANLMPDSNVSSNVACFIALEQKIHYA